MVFSGIKIRVFEKWEKFLLYFKPMRISSDGEWEMRYKVRKDGRLYVYSMRKVDIARRSKND